MSSIIETEKSKLTFSLSSRHFRSKPFPSPLELLFAFKQFFIFSGRIFKDDHGYSHQKKSQRLIYTITNSGPKTTILQAELNGHRQNFKSAPFLHTALFQVIPLALNSDAFGNK